MSRLLHPKVLVAFGLAVALLVALLVFGNVRSVFALIGSFRLIYLVPFFLLMVAYEVVRCAQWHMMLIWLDIKVPVRTQVFSYISGEVTKTLPIGNFFPDYVLQRSQGTDFGLASSATLMITLLEVGVALTGVVIIGIGDWGWLRPVILVGTFVFLLLVWMFYRWHHAPHQYRAPRRMPRWRWIQTAMNELRQFLAGEKKLLRPQAVAVGALLSAIYLILGGIALYVVALGLGVDISIWQALAVYFFSLAFAAIVPLPMDFGSTELSGVGALLAMGVSRTAAVSVLLFARALSLGSTLIIAFVTALVLRGEVRAALAARRAVIITESHTELVAPDQAAER
jgi:uncharacterized protein (TIRG00374 family)